MFHLHGGLNAGKHKELLRGLFHVQDDAIGGGFKLQSAAPVAPQTPALSVPATAARAADADLLVVQHEDTGIVQFVFPDQTVAQENRPATVSKQRFALFHPFQLATELDHGVKWMVHTALKIPRELSTDAIWAMCRAVESTSKTEGFIHLARGYDQAATDEDLRAAQGKRVLLFVHGIFSSVDGGFNDLGDPAMAGTTMQTLVDRYDGNVFGYDHWTISKTPLQNALDLLDAIPAGANWDVDVVCHSRGGLVVRPLLALVDQGANVANADLKSIAAKREGKIRSVGDVVFVGAANQGSPNADAPNVQNFLNIAALLASTTPCYSLDIVIAFAKIAVAASFNLPSMLELATTSTLVADLNNAQTLMQDARIYGVRADFDHAKSMLVETDVLINKLVMKVDNDLVVPYAGVASPNPLIPDERLLPFGTPDAPQGKVWHTEYFSQPETQTFLLKHLTAEA
jgi:hypothetical protein